MTLKRKTIPPEQYSNLLKHAYNYAIKQHLNSYSELMLDVTSFSF